MGKTQILAGVGVLALRGCLAIGFLLRLVRGRKLGYFAMCGVAGGTLTAGLGLGGW